MTMLEQLREHKLFRGKWKTSSHVAWSMIYLGLQACYTFWSKEQDDWKGFRSNYIALTEAMAESSNKIKQEQLLKTARNFRGTIHAYLDKDTVFGRYRAWVTFDKAIKARDVVEDVKSYDELMLARTAPNLDSNLVFDNRAGDMWSRVVPRAGGSIDESAADSLYIEMTQAYLDELEASYAEHED